jgi:hypothetical protein
MEQKFSKTCKVPISKLIAIPDIIVSDDPEFSMRGMKMGGSGRGKRLDRSTEKSEDPLAGLYQIDVVENPPLEEEALVLMVMMLDDFEAFDELSGNLRRIMAEDVLVETRILSLFKTLIQGARAEHKYLKMELLP